MVSDSASQGKGRRCMVSHSSIIVYGSGVLQNLPGNSVVGDVTGSRTAGKVTLPQSPPAVHNDL